MAGPETSIPPKRWSLRRKITLVFGIPSTILGICLLANWWYSHPIRIVRSWTGLKLPYNLKVLHREKHWNLDGYSLYVLEIPPSLEPALISEMANRGYRHGGFWSYPFELPTQAFAYHDTQQESWYLAKKSDGGMVLSLLNDRKLLFYLVDY